MHTKNTVYICRYFYKNTYKQKNMSLYVFSIKMYAREYKDKHEYY